MHPLRVVLATLFAASALVLAAPAPPASACSCVVQSRAEHVDNASALFVGTLAERDQDGQSVTYTFDVHEVFKGSVTRTTQVWTGAQESACGRPDLTKGEDFLVFANASGESDRLSISLCDGTVGVGPTPIEQVERLTGQGVAPEPGGPAIEDDEPFIPYWAMAGIGAGLAGLLGLGLRRGRSRTRPRSPVTR